MNFDRELAYYKKIEEAKSKSLTTKLANIVMDQTALEAMGSPVTYSLGSIGYTETSYYGISSAASIASIVDTAIQEIWTNEPFNATAQIQMKAQSLATSAQDYMDNYSHQMLQNSFNPQTWIYSTGTS